MITGCNTNVLYRGKQFHVQTEDSGRANPHIISHVYHGGTIIASEKSEYGDRIDSDELDIKVRAQIEYQHKMMLKKLTGGELDAVIDERLGGSASSAPAAPAPAKSSSGATAGGAGATDSAVSGADTAVSATKGAESTAAASGEANASERPVDTEPILDRTPSPSFGSSLDAEKPLDEVILEYLVDKARTRAVEKKQSPARPKHQKG